MSGGYAPSSDFFRQLSEYREKLGERLDQLPVESARRVIIKPKALKTIVRAHKTGEESNSRMAYHLYGELVNDALIITDIKPYTQSLQTPEDFVDFLGSKKGKGRIGRYDVCPSAFDGLTSIFFPLNAAYDVFLQSVIRTEQVMSAGLLSRTRSDGRIRLVPYTVFKEWKSSSIDPSNPPHELVFKKIKVDKRRDYGG